jgi:formylglycine-generating enzyme required for sulfatase activity
MEPKPIDPNDIGDLQRQLAELQAKLVAAQQAKSITTQGGAAVQGSVEVGGHFIGRDFIQIVTKAINSSDDPDEAHSVIAHYLEALADELTGLKLSEIDVTAQEAKRDPLQIADIYVPLNTHLSIPKDTTLRQWLVPSARRELLGETDKETRPVSALEALASHTTLTILGKPGSGKSTFGARVLLTLALAWRGHQDELAKLGEHWTHGALLPIRVILRRFAETLPKDGAPARASDLWRFIGDELTASGHGLSSKVLDYLQRIARNHGALILLDGLDECGDTKTRQRVQAACDELMRSAGRTCRFLLTARPYARPEGPDPKSGVYALADLNDEQIEAFIRAWYVALAARGWLSPGDAERKMLDLLEVRQRADLLPLAQNPLLLTLMATLHSNRGRLPDDRADLYNESVDLLILRWNRHSGADKTLLEALDVKDLKLSDLREALEEAAFKVHQENVGTEGTADIGEDRLVRIFRPLLNNSKDKADVVIDYIEKRAGLLIGQGELDGQRQFTFPHRTFQEFLAACHLAAQGDFAIACAGLARAATDHWSVVLPLAARLAKAERGASAADELIHGVTINEFRETATPGATDWACARVAGLQLLEIGLSGINKSDRTRAIAARVAGWLAAALPLHPEAGGESAIQRAQAGDVLAQLGDPRFDQQYYCLPADDNYGFIHIAADANFKIGTRKSDAKRITEFTGSNAGDEELNDELTPTDEFYIARYPVTVAQFRAFVEATQFEVGDDDALRDADTHPVRYVNWHEARKYCDWLHKEFATSDALKRSRIARLISQGWQVTLPSELEWEKAARGTLENRVFPWGDDPDANRANYDDTGINDTSAVGCFPKNSYGLYDMVGNVWEWTRSLWGKDLFKSEFPYPYARGDSIRENLEATDDVRRVVRGGSWFDGRDFARCAIRLRFLPDDRRNFIGFRLVLRSPPV